MTFTECVGLGKKRGYAGEWNASLDAFKICCNVRDLTQLSSLLGEMFGTRDYHSSLNFSIADHIGFHLSD